MWLASNWIPLNHEAAVRHYAASIGEINRSIRERVQRTRAHDGDYQSKQASNEETLLFSAAIFREGNSLYQSES